MEIAIYGAGYVGLVTSACFSAMGNHVRCVDTDAAKVAGLKRGEVPIAEPGLEALVRANTRAGRLEFCCRLDEHPPLVFIAVGTPPNADGSADLSHVLDAAGTIGERMSGPTVIVEKSTVPVGTAERVRAKVAEALAARGATHRFAVVSNPEFLKEGAAVEDFMRPDRIIIGSDDHEATTVLERLYAPFNRNRDKIQLVDVRSAELAKYAANVMLATKISLMNEFANLADRVGADIEAVRRCMGSDPRIGHHFIYPGCGYGGSCFPKDVRALVSMARNAGFNTEVARAVHAVNERQKRVLVDKMLAYFGGSLAGRTIALWGLAFKPNTDDMREAPSRDLMEGVWGAGGYLRAYDPLALGEACRLYGTRGDLVLCPRREDTLEGADALAVITEWNEFREPDFAAIRAALKTPVVFDGRNLYDPALLTEAGLTHIGVGRGNRRRPPPQTGCGSPGATFLSGKELSQ